MRATDGAYYASIDADSEGEEGRYYVWARDDVRAALDDGEWAIASRHYGLDGPPNFEGRAWHLRVVAPLADIAARLGIALDQARATLDLARAKLLAVRSTRVRPGLDDKVLTSWNALAITGLARAARALDEPRGVRRPGLRGARRARGERVARRPAPRDAARARTRARGVSRRSRVPARSAGRGDARAGGAPTTTAPGSSPRR